MPPTDDLRVVGKTDVPPITVTRESGVATITLNRPEAMNALSVEAKVLLRDHLELIAEDQTVRCVVLTGAGSAFCVGQDLKEHVTILHTGDIDTLFATVPDHYNRIVMALRTMDKPVIAAVNGIAAGAGASLAWACDLRILSSSGGFNTSFAGVALSCDTGSSWTLPRLVGPAKALELLYFPRTIRAAEAMELGLANRVVEADQLMGVVTEMAQTLAAGPTLAFGAMRRSVDFSATHTLAESLAVEAEAMTLTGGSRDHRAAVDAFLAKQQPHFEGS